MQLTHLGINLLTGGEKIFYKVEMVDFFPKCSFVLRPMNYPQKTPGKGYRIVEIAGKRVAIINMLGQSGFSRVCVMNPLNAADMILTKLRDEADVFLFQFHSATTAESATFAHYVKRRGSDSNPLQGPDIGCMHNERLRVHQRQRPLRLLHVGRGLQPLL